MEGMIATLLKDFEDGKMDRRQLIQSLALVAVAGPAAAAGATQAPAPRRRGGRCTSITSPYAVSDYKRSAAFYSSLMGWEVANDNGTSQATLKIGDIGEIIIRNARRPAEGAAAHARCHRIGAARRASADHRRDQSRLVGISPWDTEGVKAELEKRGLKPRADMVGNDFKSWHVLDPDGWDLQISNQTK